MRVLGSALLLMSLAATPAAASVEIGAKQVVVTTAAGSRAIVTRSPLRIAFANSSGQTVLSGWGESGAGLAVVPPVPHNQFGTQSPPPPTLYAPLSFLVGSQSISQFPASQWQGDLQTVTSEGVIYAATKVTAASAPPTAARTVRLNDPASGTRHARRSTRMRSTT